MKLAVMREVDVIRVADFVAKARENLGQPEAVPLLAYWMMPEYKPTYAYKYYNIRSRHFRLEEVFLVVYGDDTHAAIHAVLTLGEFARQRAFVKLVVLGPEFVDGQLPKNSAWLFDEATTEMRKYLDLQALRLLVARQGEARDLVGPVIHPSFLAAFPYTGFRELATLQREGGRDIGVEIYERASIAD